MPDRRGDVRLRSHIVRRRAIFGMLIAVCVAAWPAAAPAVPAPGPGKARAYVAFFLGQGGYLFSWGIPRLEAEARQLGFVTDVFSYDDVNKAWATIARRRKEGYRIALVGYSLGNTTATYLQSHLPVDLLLAIAESSLGQNHPIRKENTRRAVLWYGPDSLSNAGVHDGFNETNYIDSTHLLMDTDPRVVAGVLHELRGLLAPERPGAPVVAANVPASVPVNLPARVPLPKPRVAPAEDETLTAAALQALTEARPQTTSATATDITCTKCWGFEQSLASPVSDPWMQ